MIADTFKDIFESEHVIVPYPEIIPLHWGEKVKIRAVAKFLYDLDWREPFIRNDDFVPDIIIQNKRPVGDGVNDVNGEHFSTDGIHCLDVVGIYDGDIPVSFNPCLIGESGKIIDDAGVLLEHPIDCDKMIGSHLHCPLLVEQPASVAVLSDPLQKIGYSVRRHSDARIIPADECSVVLRRKPVV